MGYLGYLVIFGFFRFRPKMSVLLCYIFRFRSKMLFALGRKCYVCNWTVTMFCDIGLGTGDSFSGENGISFSSAFSFTAENDKCIFGRPLHQTVSDYVNDFQTLNNSGSGQPVLVPWEISFTLHFWHKSSFIIIVIVA